MMRFCCVHFGVPLPFEESFDSYLSIIGLELTAKYNGQDTNAYIKFVSTFNISPCSETEVIQQTYSIKNNSSSGYDEIFSRFLVLAAEELATP